MRYKALFSFFLAVLSSTALAAWEKINDVDYTWGPFKIYNISLFTETGEYQPNIRPLMLTLKYSKPVDGRDFAISIAKSWETLGIKLPAQEDVIDRLRKILPDLKPDDSLSYIALEDRGYFVLNDQVIAQEFNAEFNDAMLAIWLDPKAEFNSKLTTKKAEGDAQEVLQSTEYPQILDEVSVKKANAPEFKDETAQTEQAVDFDQYSAKTEPVQPPKKVELLKVGEALKIVLPAPSPTTPAPTPPQEAEKTAEPEKPAEAPAQPVVPKPAEPKTDPENPEKEILPEFDPIPAYQLPIL